MTRESTPQQKGREYEKRFSKKHNLETVPNSGAGRFRKLDVEGIRLLLSLKWTANKSYSITKSDLDEVDEAVRGPGGLGGDYIGMLVTELEGEDFVTLRFDDLVGLLTEKPALFQPDKNQVKRRRASVPSLFRE
jgi:hypothetical protein